MATNEEQEDAIKLDPVDEEEEQEDEEEDEEEDDDSEWDWDSDEFFNRHWEMTYQQLVTSFRNLPVDHWIWQSPEQFTSLARRLQELKEGVLQELAFEQSQAVPSKGESLEF